jgi:mutator protein MutT
VGNPLQVTAGVIAHDGRVLVCQRPLGGDHPGKWEFPGGKVEPGEDLAACIRRELQEELGIDATVGRALWQSHHHYPGRDPIVLTFFLIPHYERVPTNRVFAAMAWVRVGDLPSIDLLDGDREFVAQLASGRVRLDSPATAIHRLV